MVAVSAVKGVSTVAIKIRSTLTVSSIPHITIIIVIITIILNKTTVVIIAIAKAI